jgi:hypothetical protein
MTEKNRVASACSSIAVLRRNQMIRDVATHVIAISR